MQIVCTRPAIWTNLAALAQPKPGQVDMDIQFARLDRLGLGGSQAIWRPAKIEPMVNSDFQVSDRRRGRHPRWLV